MASLNRPRGKPPPAQRSCVAATTAAVGCRYGTLIRMAAPGDRVRADDRQLLGRELPVLVDERRRERQLADVVHQRGAVHVLAGQLRQRQRARDGERPTPPRGARAPAAAAARVQVSRICVERAGRARLRAGASRPPAGRAGGRCRAARSAALTPWRRTSGSSVSRLAEFNDPRGSHCRVRIGTARPGLSPGPARQPADEALRPISPVRCGFSSSTIRKPW